MSSTAIAATAALERSRRRLALLALCAGALAIGSSPIFVRLSEAGPIATGVWRTGLAVLPALLWAAGEARPASGAVGPRERVFAVLAGLCLAGDLASWHISLGLTTVAKATLFSNAAPIFVTLAGAILFRQRITRRFLVALGVACAGAVLIQAGSGAGTSGGTAEGAPAGDALALLAALFYSGYILLIARVRTRMGTGAVLLWTSAAAAIALLPAAILSGEVLLPATAGGLAVLAGIGWISHAGGQGMVTFALAWLPAAFISLTLLLQPVVAALLAWLLLAEPVGVATAIGGAIVLVGIALARRG